MKGLKILRTKARRRRPYSYRTCQKWAWLASSLTWTNSCWISETTPKSKCFWEDKGMLMCPWSSKTEGSKSSKSWEMSGTSRPASPKGSSIIRIWSKRAPGLIRKRFLLRPLDRLTMFQVFPSSQILSLHILALCYPEHKVPSAFLRSLMTRWMKLM